MEDGREGGGDPGADAGDPGPADRALCDELDAGFARVAERAGDHLVCAPGCDDCCHGVFPITRLDVWRLRRGLTALEAAEPSRAEGIRRRASTAARSLPSDFPGIRSTGRLADDPEALDAYFERIGRRACPVLDPATGRCELYEHRPVACRTFGPPLAFGAERAPHCGLCFRDADEPTVEACRWAPDPDARERALLTRLGAPEDEVWSTLIELAIDPPPD